MPVRGIDHFKRGRTAQATVSVLTIAALLGVGLYAWRREGEGRFGPVLFATGVCWFFVTSGLVMSVAYENGFIWMLSVAVALARVPRLQAAPANPAAVSAA